MDEKENNYELALSYLDDAKEYERGEPGEAYFLRAAQVLATLAVVDILTEISDKLTMHLWTK